MPLDWPSVSEREGYILHLEQWSLSVRFPTRNLIFDDIRFVGFWLDRWKRKKSLSQLRNSLEEVLQPLALNEVKYPIDSVFAIDDFKAALRRNSESRFGKVLLARDKEMIEKSIN